MAAEKKASREFPRLICILADTSRSMAGAKADAATKGIQDMMYECQSRGEHSNEQFAFLLITFDKEAQMDPFCKGGLVGDIDPETIQIKGFGKGTNITAALQLLLLRLQPIIQQIQGLEEPARRKSALPLVFLFSDGKHNCGDPQPKAVADQIKQLTVDGDSVIIAAAGVAVEGGRPDEEMLCAIAHPGCYAHITDLDTLVKLIGEVSRSAAKTPKDLAAMFKKAGNWLQNARDSRTETTP